MSLHQSGPNKPFNPMMAMFSAYAKLFTNIPGFLFLAAAPIGLAMVLHVVTVTWPGDPTSFLFFLGAQLLQNVFVISFAVSWLRYCRFGTFNKLHPFLLPFGPREGQIFVYYCLLWLPLHIVIFRAVKSQDQQISQAEGMLIFIVAIATLFVAPRLSLLFPAIAQDQVQNPRQIWAKTRGYFFPLVLAIMVSVLPFIPIMLSLGVVAKSESLIGAFISLTLMMVLNYMMIAIMFTILDIAHQSIGGGNLPVPGARGPRQDAQGNGQ